MRRGREGGEFMRCVTSHCLAADRTMARPAIYLTSDPNDLFENDIITPQTPIYFAFLSSSRPAGLTKRDFFRINFKGNKGKNLDFHSSETRNT